MQVTGARAAAVFCCDVEDEERSVAGMNDIVGAVVIAFIGLVLVGLVGVLL